MNSIRKIKRRAMARLSEPRIELRFDGAMLALLRGIPTSMERENLIRTALMDYIKNRRNGK